MKISEQGLLRKYDIKKQVKGITEATYSNTLRSVQK